MSDQRQPWYERPAPVFALMISAAFAAFLFLILWYGIGYYRDFKAGKNVVLPQFQNRFTPGSLASAKPAGQLIDVTSADAPALGSPQAKVTIVEFGDYACPYTKEVWSAIRRLAAERPDQIRYLWRDYPLEPIHPRGRAAAAAASCAGAQSKYWQYQDKLFINQGAFEREDFIRYAEEIGLESSSFVKCLDAGGNKERIERDLAAGAAAAIRGTPTFFINGRRVEGAIPYDVLSQIVDKLTAAQ